MQRARQIAEKPRNIVSPQCRLSYGETKLLAFVAASSGWTDRYRVQVALDEDHGKVLDFACTCPASMRTDGMCKHAAALALAYLHEPERFAGFKRNRAPETSPSITAFMHRAERAAHDDVPAGSVRIDVTLSYGFENWSARFKIRGPQSSYVMKSISDFAEAFETGAVVTYGKRLSFAHTLGAFDARSRRLVSFIRRAVERRSQQEGALSWHTRSRRAAVGRALDLSEEEAVDLVDLIADAPFDLDCTDGSMPAHQSVTVVDEDPRVPLRIEREEDGGYLIERDEAIVFACAADRMIVLRDATLHRCTPSFARVGEFLRGVYRSNDDSLFIAPEDAPLFCATVLPLLEDTIGVDAPPELEALRPVPGELTFYFDRAEKVIYTVVQVATNDLIILVAFVPIVKFLLGVSNVSVPWDTLILSVVLFVVIPLSGGMLTRYFVTQKKGKEYFENTFVKKFDGITTVGLLLTLVLIFAFQGQVILDNPLHIVLIAVPLILQTFLIFGIAYGACRLLKLPHRIAAPAGMIGASNFFELAVAVAVALFGTTSPAALATTVGVLTEVPVMLFLVKIANKTKGRFPA